MKLTTQQALTLSNSIDILFDDETCTMIPGCDCGCGGDTEDWDYRAEQVVEAERFLAELGISIEFK